MKSENMRAILVSEKTYKRMEEVFGSLGSSADAPIDSMLSYWLNNNKDEPRNISLRSNSPLESFRFTTINSVTVSLLRHGKFVQPVTINDAVPSWSSLSVWLVEHIFLSESGKVCVLFDVNDSSEHCQRIIDLPEENDHRKRVLQGCSFITKESVDQPTPRGWMTIEGSRYALRGTSSMQSMRLIRQLVTCTDESMILSMKLTWANRPGAFHSGCTGSITLGSRSPRSDQTSDIKLASTL